MKINEKNSQIKKIKNIPLIFILILSFIYFISQFYRASVGVISPLLMQELEISPETMGRLGGIFFLCFALAQIPLGIFLDYYNERIVIIIMLFYDISEFFCSVKCGIHFSMDIFFW